jgi:TolB-like protein/DNA-binding winged helix-turn-helix (wHTH) protein/Flp pilus assembly protein TadD
MKAACGARPGPVPYLWRGQKKKPMTAVSISRLESFRVGDWVVEPARDVLQRGDEAIKLEPRTMRVLAYLAERPLQVVSQTELEQSVWAGVVVTSQSVYQSIAQLRRVFGDTPRQPRYIETIQRKGYRLIAPVAPATQPPEPGGAAELPAAVPGTTPMAPPAPPVAEVRAGGTRRKRLLAGGLSLLFLVVLGTVALLHGRAQPAGELASIAVLPFADLSAKSDNAAFCDGLTEELMSRLGQLTELRVTARNSAFEFRGHGSDVQEIGTRLGVSHVLHGSVRRTGERVRVIAALVDAKSGFQLWTQTFDGSMGEILSVQEEIARDVAEALEIRLSDAAAERIKRVPTANVGAYELYLLGRYSQRQRTPEALDKAVAYQREAIAQDPRFALAYAGLADAYMAGFYYMNRSLEDTAALVEPQVAKAIALDPSLGAGYQARAVLRTEQSRLDEAIADLERAIELEPNDTEALVRLGGAHEYRAEPREAIKAYDQAAQLDPLHLVLIVRRCLALQNLGRYADAESACQRGIELGPSVPNAYWAHGLNALAQGDLRGAIAGYKAALERAPARTDLLSQLGWLWLDAGDPAQASRAFDASVTHQSGSHTHVELERARLVVATGAPADLGTYLRGVDLTGTPEQIDLIDAALLTLLAGDIHTAAALVERAHVSQDGPSALSEGVWETRWGRSQFMTLALVSRANGDDAAAERYLKALEQWLDRVENQGHVWHGADYLRASIAAMRGQNTQALRSLERAIERGWRRPWWMRVDPALRGLRGEPHFVQLLQRTEALARQ